MKSGCDLLASSALHTALTKLPRYSTYGSRRVLTFVAEALVLDAFDNPTSSTSSVIDGTVKGSNSSAQAGSIGTQTRPIRFSQKSKLIGATIPVLGWTQNGLFKRWFTCVVTLSSKRGYVY